MPRRKGYGIPATKHVEKTESNSSESCPNGTTTNGIRYLHKKFKKMAAILTDDCAPISTPHLPVVGGAEVSNGGNKCVYISTAPPVACSPVAPPSTSSNMMTAAVATTPTATATLPSEEKQQLNKLGLQLKIPTAAFQSSSRSTPSTPSSFGGSSPSPEFLQRHISKLISENQAIVETTDPFWSRKFYQRSKENSSPSSPLSTSSSSCSGFEQLKRKQPPTFETVEEKLPSKESKLANALMHPRPVIKSVSMNDMNGSGGNGGITSSSICSSNNKVAAAATEESQPLNLTMSKEARFVRPTSLPLQPGTFVPKKLMAGAVAVLPLISPETPRPNKSYGQLYIGGNAYTYLGLKCSTRSTFCTLHKSQPTYVPLSPEYNKISMYSNWKVRSEVDPYLRSVSATRAMACYDSRQRSSPYTLVHAKTKDAVTHSSYWAKRAKVKTTGGNSKSDNEEDNKGNKTQLELAEEGLERMVTSAAGDDEEDGEEEENEDDYSEEDPKCQLEREVAKSLLSLSKISHQTVSEQYANAGLVPLNARPNTYPYNYSAVTYLSSKPHTPTLMLISEQKERETVSKNTGLARELQPTVKPGEVMKQKCESPAQTGDRYYFGSSCEKEVPKIATDLQESVIKDSTTVTSVFPIDLSSKNVSAERKVLVPMAVSGASAIVPNSAVISEILTPVSEPVLLATICSTTDRLSAVTGGAAAPPPSPVSNPNAPDATEGSVMLQTYLKERAVQDLKIKQQYQSPHIKVEQRDFNLKFNVYNEAFQKGAAVAAAACVTAASHTSVPITEGDKTDDVRTIPGPKRKNHFMYENDTDKAFLSRAKLKMDCANDSDSKENFALTPTEGEKSDCSTSVIILVGNPNSGTNNSPKRLKAEFISPCSGPLPKYASVLEDGRSKCVVCNKVFSKPSQLRLHVNIHYFEQPFRCEACAVSFRTKGHLHKHLGSNSHLNKVSMNSAGNGQTSTSNPRPFKCDDCSVGFRIHGHLAKHLRSKMHIMKLECLGKLPFGTYAEMERCGINMNDIDTTDCENSLESLQRIAKGVVGSVMYVNNADDEGGKMITDNAPF